MDFAHGVPSGQTIVNIVLLSRFIEFYLKRNPPTYIKCKRCVHRKLEILENFV